MTLDEFKHNVELYSADLSRWPQDAMKRAISFMRENHEAKELFDEALALDAKLRLFEPKEPDMQALETRIMAAIAQEDPRVPQETMAVKWRASWIFAPSGGLMAVALVGFILGFNPKPAPYVPLDPAYAAEQQLASADDYIYDAFEGEVF